MDTHVKGLVAFSVAAFLTCCCASLPAVADTEYECLTTPNGIPKKVIVKKQNIVAFANQDFSGSRKPLKFFRKYFVFKESEQGFQIGEATRRASTLGWVRRENCIPWDNQQAVFFINKKTGRMPVRIWRQKDDVGNTDRAHFEETLSCDFTTEPFPILQRDESFVEVAFLWDGRGQIPSLEQDLASSGGDNRQADLLQGKRIEQGTKGKALPHGRVAAQQMVEQAKCMDLVLVIDITGSMGEYMDSVRAKLIEIVDSLETLTKEGPEITIRVGVLGYRDYADGKVTSRLDLTADMAQVRTFLRPESGFTPSGGAGRNEAVCDAIYEACQMAWADHALRVICLVGDAPPHTSDDDDIRAMKTKGTTPSSQFFAMSFDESVSKIREEINKQRIVFYPISVGGYEDTERAFRQLATDPSRSLSLSDSASFIASLDKELRKTREVHDTTLKAMENVAEGRISPSDLNDENLEYFKLIGINPVSLAEMHTELIQTGWFQPHIGKDATVAVYVQRRKLDQWAEDLRLQLEVFREKMSNVFEDILSMSTGDEARNLDLNTLTQASKDLPFKPKLVDPKYRIGMEEEAMIKNLRRKLNNIMILLNNDRLFSNYEEGWVPMEYLPGAL